ncbi:MAG TPA: dihydrodipicolinate synthase family protein [Vicinamibacterales bacterium]|nr:dihydrodipicolinate synthase family protein [Vicinamibacterales bacterium]HPW19820.1 dihydrodipicolinate synthase family protein [Vicinamibacterales bacterium]
MMRPTAADGERARPGKAGDWASATTGQPTGARRTKEMETGPPFSCILPLVLNLAGIYPPIATPFGRGEVDYASLQRNVERLMTTGLRGVLALGTNGEAAHVDEREAERIIGAARERVPAGRVLLAGTGRQSTRAVIAATSRAAQAGADAVLVLTPFFFKSRMTHDALVEHYRAIADASPVPVLLYTNTAVTGVNLAPDTVAAIAAHPNVVGMKDSNGDVAQMEAVIARVPAGFALFAGSAPAIHPSILAGAAGAIVAVANVVPGLCVRLFELARAGRQEEARRLQARITPLAVAVTKEHGIAGLKAAMDMAGYTGGEVRGPLRPITEQAREEIRRLVDALVRE